MGVGIRDISYYPSNYGAATDKALPTVSLNLSLPRWLQSTGKTAAVNSEKGSDEQGRGRGRRKREEAAVNVGAVVNGAEVGGKRRKRDIYTGMGRSHRHCRGAVNEGGEERRGKRLRSIVVNEAQVGGWRRKRDIYSEGGEEVVTTAARGTHCCYSRRWRKTPLLSSFTDGMNSVAMQK
ncbi:hypothetical protein BHE74_00032306 [Ensete ventricosum]|nr:hypothetical protein BHE74_00032306 [Ensete ventricosum]